MDGPSRTRRILALWTGYIVVALITIGLLPVAALEDRLLAAWVALAYPTVGAAIVLRRPGNPVGWLCIALGLVPAIGHGLELAAYLQVRDTSPAAGWARLAAWLSTWLPTPAFVVTVATAVTVFPDGRFDRPIWRVPILIALGSAVASLVLALTPGWTVEAGGIPITSPMREIGSALGLARIEARLAGIEDVLVIVAIATAVLAPIDRYIAGDPRTRAQVRWVGATSAVLLAGVIAAYAIPEIGWAIGGIAVIVATVAFPVSIVVAITRYHLFEIDRIISRGVAYVLVTTILGGVAWGGILILQPALATVTEGDALAVASSTLAAAAAFQPLRTRLKDVVDRRFDRARIDGDRVVTAFAGRLRDELDLTTLSTDIADTAGMALQPTVSDLWLRSPGAR